MHESHRITPAIRAQPGAVRDQRLADLATRQGGAVSAAQLRALGMSSSAVARAVARRRLHPLHRGVYAVGHLDVGVRGRRFAAVLACGDWALL